MPFFLGLLRFDGQIDFNMFEVVVVIFAAMISTNWGHLCPAGALKARPQHSPETTRWDDNWEVKSLPSCLVLWSYKPLCVSIHLWDLCVHNTLAFFSPWQLARNGKRQRLRPFAQAPTVVMQRVPVKEVLAFWGLWSLEMFSFLGFMSNLFESLLVCFRFFVFSCRHELSCRETSGIIPRSWTLLKEISKQLTSFFRPNKLLAQRAHWGLPPFSWGKFNQESTPITFVCCRCHRT